MEKKFLVMNDGKKIYAQIYNEGHKDYVLVLHGGPGAGCYDFQYQALELSKYFNVVLFDQRGVLRSESLEEDEAFGIDYLVEDCENIKNILGINSLYVWGHSFGGLLALLYGAKYPESVKKIIFECPSFNFIESTRNIYSKFSEIMESKGDSDGAIKCKTLAENDIDLKIILEHFGQISKDIKDEAYQNMTPMDRVKNINSSKDIKEEEWKRFGVHLRKLLNEGKLNDNFMPLISELKSPSLLMVGENDPICTKKQRDCYLKNSIMGEFLEVKGLGHEIHNIIPEEFTKIAVEFFNS